MTEFFQIEDALLAYHPDADVRLLEKAYVFSAFVHRGRSRVPGEPYLEHPLEVASILTRLHLDDRSVASGLLHDTLEEGLTSPEELEKAFGPTVTRIIEGLTRVNQFHFGNDKEKAQAETLRKMILAMTTDLRIILITLADRLHDLRVADRFPPDDRRRMAQEAIDIFAPLAGRLGIEWIKLQLEDLAFRWLEPEAYEAISQGLAQTREEQRSYVEEVRQILTQKLSEQGLGGRIIGRSKHLYSIYLKMMKQNLDLDRIYDLIAFRIIVDSVPDCYEALGIVHASWEPVPGRYKDYIARPKPNMYQSLHTTVIGPLGERMEIQIRTEEMDRIAREGIAAHWLYKEGRPLQGVSQEETQRFSWLRQLLEPERGWQDPKTFFDSLQVELYPDEVYVFSPEGDVKVLPRGATPVDFAYHIHTEVGHRCVGARVNGKIVPLRYELQNGDTVEILTASKHRPSKDWLSFVKTSKAKGRIRHWIKTEERDRSIAMGREICEREFRKRGLNFNHYINSQELLDVARGLSLKSVEDLLASIGYRKISPVQVIGRLPMAQEDEEPSREEAFLEKIPERKRAARGEEGVRVQGVDDVMIRVARCCNPLPGEPIVGYITRGRGITVHRKGCKNVSKGDLERRIDVQWDSGESQSHPVDIVVTYDGDRTGVGVLSALLGQLDVGVVDVKIGGAGNGLSRFQMRIEVRDTEHLSRVITALRNEKHVYRVQRIAE